MEKVFLFEKEGEGKVMVINGITTSWTVMRKNEK